MSEYQQSLFDLEPESWQLDAGAMRLVASVVLADGPDGSFDYLVPPEMSDATERIDQLEVGRRVQVPFGRRNRLTVGYCIRLEFKPVGSRRLKTVAALLDPRSLLSPSMLRLTQWIADYYLCPWGQVLQAVLPGGVRKQAGTRRVTLLSVPDEILARLSSLKLPAKQREALACLAKSSRSLTLHELAQRTGCTAAPVQALKKKGLIIATQSRIPSFQAFEFPTPPRESPRDLNPDQTAALAAIQTALDAGEHRTILIHGVTGSGKTEVYIRAIEETVRFGRQAIVLVPEISLTPQTVERFRARFDTVAVLHSHQSDTERHWHWYRIAEGAVQVVIGARSAVFAPTPNLGLIVIDEEHESSFKQDIAPRYHARDVAQYRAMAERVPLVLGSATPSLESYYRALGKKQTDVEESSRLSQPSDQDQAPAPVSGPISSPHYQLVEMPRRIFNRPLPGVGLIDLRLDRHDQPFRGSISRRMQQAIGEALRKGGKVMLLLNRRGFSTHIQCPVCGKPVVCPDCDIPLTFHRTNETALCHYCDYEIPAPNECPHCKTRGIRYSGTGTQRLESEVRARFPDAPCLRMDTDSMRRSGSHAKALAAFRDGAARILIGTQMIAKGHDFPDVTLVGVIQADTALHFPDFRASERTFQLITQVAGRTGRGDAGGHVLVQTLSPDHPAIHAAARHNYQAFVDQELPHRKALGYPPFGSMIRIVVRGAIEHDTRFFAEKLSEEIQAASTSRNSRIRILGPAPAPFAKLRGKFRFQILLRGPEIKILHDVVQAATRACRPPESVHWIVDVDPQDML
ncbi:MAG: primosomal protein N' [Pirellulales bacterium]|nr:primosomal protein N' [Pirellulales bacterium]